MNETHHAYVFDRPHDYLAYAYNQQQPLVGPFGSLRQPDRSQSFTNRRDDNRHDYTDCRASTDYWATQSDAQLAPVLFSAADLPAIVHTVSTAVTPSAIATGPTTTASTSTSSNIMIRPNETDGSGQVPEQITVQGTGPIAFSPWGTAITFVNASNQIIEIDTFSGDTMTVTAYRKPTISTAIQETMDELNIDLTGYNLSSQDISHYGSQLASGSQTYSQIRNAIAHSQTGANVVNAIYQQVLGRAADPSGLAAYENGMGGQGMSVQDVRASLATSAEAQGDVGNLYQTILGRPADASDLAGWQHRLAAQYTLAQETQIFATSSEAVGDIKSVFDQGVMRDPTATDYTGMENYLASGGTMAAVQSAVMSSQEAHNAQSNTLYQSLVNEEGNRIDVYKDSLGRLTVGIGHLVQPSDNLNFGQIISQTQVIAFYQQDSAAALTLAQNEAAGLAIPISNSNFIAALADANFQLGDFAARNPNTWGQIAAGQYEDAANSLNNGSWMAQTPTRVEQMQAALVELPAQTSY